MGKLIGFYDYIVERNFKGILLWGFLLAMSIIGILSTSLGISKSFDAWVDSAVVEHTRDRVLVYEPFVKINDHSGICPKWAKDYHWSDGTYSCCTEDGYCYLPKASHE